MIGQDGKWLGQAGFQLVGATVETKVRESGWNIKHNMTSWETRQPTLTDYVNISPLVTDKMAPVEHPYYSDQTFLFAVLSVCVKEIVSLLSQILFKNAVLWQIRMSFRFWFYFKHFAVPY